uniref:Interferon regulatory factor 3 n=1 Tax=Salvator merianae TaxID=96440 RepID=A0A8D0KNM8_SALMN
MGTQRPLIVPWLVEQLDAQRYPGVSWLNAERSLFRVPWKHGSRQSVSSEDFQIFEDWAIARGRYRPGVDQRTPSEWKRNFRSALNRKEGIKMIQDNSTDADDPHKVFEIQPDANLNGFAQVEADSMVSDSAVPDGSTDVCGDSSSLSQDDTLESVLSALDISSNTEEYSMLGAENPVSCGGLPSSHMDHIVPVATVSPLEQICGSNTFESDFDVRVYYRGRLVLAEVYKNVRGLCFVPPGCSSCYPDLANVMLPDTNSLNDQQQVYYTNRILQGMVPGVLLRIQDSLLCGTRQGHSHVFWSHSEMPADGMPHGELPKDRLCPIYHLQQFLQELIGYLEDRNGSPNYNLWFCFGEKWPDTERPWKKKLIMVQVIPKTLETLHELSQAQGASSLKNCERDLRISDSLQKYRLQEHLKEWGEKMELQFN